MSSSPKRRPQVLTCDPSEELLNSPLGRQVDFRDVNKEKPPKEAVAAVVDSHEITWIEEIPLGIPVVQFWGRDDYHALPVACEYHYAPSSDGRFAAEAAGVASRKVWRTARDLLHEMGGPYRVHAHALKSAFTASDFFPSEYHFRALVLGGFGGPYGILGNAWVDALRRCGFDAAIGLGSPEECEAWEPDLVICLYARSAWDRNRDVFRWIRRNGVPIAFLGYEDPYESEPFRKILRVVCRDHPHVFLTTDPGVLLHGFFDDVNAYYAPHCWSPLFMPRKEDMKIALDNLAGLEACGQGVEVVTVGHNYATRFEFFAKLPYLMHRYRWLTIGKDYHLNTRGLVVPGAPLRACVAYAVAVNLHVVHHRDMMTAHGRWTCPVAATNLNMTLVQMAAAGAAQVSDWRPSLEHHFTRHGEQTMESYRTPNELLKLLDEYRDEDVREFRRRQQQQVVLNARSSYTDRVLFIARELGLNIKVDPGEPPVKPFGYTAWDPIRRDALRDHEALCKPGLGNPEAAWGKVNIQ